MKYTFEIKLGAAAYVDLYPNNETHMEGEWETGTMVWRERITELKITKALNSDVYDTLESWYDDSDYFETMIFVRVNKDDVEDSIHWFGVKWGAINKDVKTFAVEPIPYDFWGQYFGSTKDIKVKWGAYALPKYYFFDTTPPYTFIDDSVYSSSFYYQLLGLLTATTWPSSDVVSSFLFGDDFEDTTPLGTVRGSVEDYVTGERSWMIDSGMMWPDTMTLSEYIDLIKIFNVYLFFDSNNKLRLEHIKFFNDKLADNAVDFSAYINEYDNKFSYDKTELPVIETFSMGQQENDDDEDFVGYSIIYSNARNRPDIMSIDETFPMYSNLEYYADNSLTDRSILFSATQNKSYEWFNIDMNACGDGPNYVVMNYTTGQFCGSNTFHVSATGYSLSVIVQSISGNVDIYLKKRAGSTISNVVNVSSTGTTSDTLTATESANDAYLCIEAKANGAMSANIVLEETVESQRDVPTVTAIITGDLKTNGAFSHGNIFHAYWQDNRPSGHATFNGSDYVFNGTAFNLRRETVKFHYSGVKKIGRAHV